MKLGFLGGAFDPVHLGHLLIAQDALEGLALDRLYFVPARVPPLKGRELVAGPKDRLAMVRLALEGEPRFAVLDDELRRPGPSYTVDTVRALRDRFPGAELFWVVGSDQLAQLDRWKDAAELARLVAFVHLVRPGVEPPAAPAIPGLRLHAVPSHPVAIGSTELRARASRGLPLRHFVPLKVQEYIESQSLYRTPA